MVQCTKGYGFIVPQGESQGLKGRDLAKFVKECMKKTS